MKSFFIGNIEIKTPVIQGGMGVGISLSGLASAVANEGGVGVISCAGLGLLYPKGKGTYPEKCINGLKEEIRKARAKTKGIIGVNVMVALSNYADMVRTAIEEKIDVVFSGAGLPLDLPSYLTPESTTKLVPIVSSSRAAKIICDKWQKNYNYLPDAIVVEGPKAGGHLGFKKEQLQDQHYALETLIPEVVMIASSYKEQKQIPVIAAGGISTGEDIAHFMGLGAAGVQMGSIFVTTQECDASETFKEVYIHSKSEDVLIKKEQLQDQHYALETLIPEVVMIASSYKEQKQIPVIAAGGISTGEDIAHFMGLGAAGVQMGSIFVTTQECDASETFKEVYIHSKSEDVLIIESPVGMPGRAIDGEFIHNVNSGLERPKSCSFHCIKTCDYTKSPYCIIKALYNAAKGNMKKGYAFAGSNAFLAEKISSVKEVMSTLEREFFLATHKLA